MIITLCSYIALTSSRPDWEYVEDNVRNMVCLPRYVTPVYVMEKTILNPALNLNILKSWLNL